MSFAALPLLIAAALAGGGQNAEPVDAADAELLTPEARQAEYNRLAEEIQRLARRNAWAGVERYYAQLEATGVPIEFDELVTGAHAARALGDARHMRERLDTAKDLRESRDVIEWLAQIDADFGAVTLLCDPEWKHRPALSTEAMPFDPNLARAVQFAIKQVADSCTFEGLLPAGAYRFGDHAFQVKPRVESVYIDTRGEPPPRPKKRGDP